MVSLYRAIHLTKQAGNFVLGDSGAGSGMAGRAAAIPIWNLVWRRHTNPRCRYFARFNRGLPKNSLLHYTSFILLLYQLLLLIDILIQHTYLLTDLGLHIYCCTGSGGKRPILTLCDCKTDSVQAVLHLLEYTSNSFLRYRMLTSSSTMAGRPRKLGDFKKARVNGGTDNDSLKDTHMCPAAYDRPASYGNQTICSTRPSC